jgi:hypothetical protein
MGKMWEEKISRFFLQPQILRLKNEIAYCFWLACPSFLHLENACAFSKNLQRLTVANHN